MSVGESIDDVATAEPRPDRAVYRELAAEALAGPERVRRAAVSLLEALVRLDSAPRAGAAQALGELGSALDQAARERQITPDAAARLDGLRRRAVALLQPMGDAGPAS